MIKNLKPLTYSKSLWLWSSMIRVTTVFALRVELLKLDRFNQKKKKKKRAKKPWYSIYQAICTVVTHLISLQSPKEHQSVHQKTVPCNRLKRSNIQKHGESLGSKLTNHIWQNFLRSPRFALYALTFESLPQPYWFVYKKVWHPLYSINMFIGSFFFISIWFK